MLLPNDWLDHDLSEIACLAPLQEIHLALFERKSVRVFIKREDLLHPLVGGNKVYKLHGYLKEYLASDSQSPILSFGGAHSNHILALAVLGEMCDIPTIGVIRGEEPETLSDTLIDAKKLGMRLVFVSRSDYRRRNDADYLQTLKDEFGDVYCVPEGGSGKLGAVGCMALAEGITLSAEFRPEFVFHACGTGASLAGLIAGFERQPVGGIYTHGVSVLKGYTALKSDIFELMNALGSEAQSWSLLQDYHGGGYAKLPNELASFMQEFEKQTQLDLDPVYTAKVMWAINDLIEKDHFPAGSNIIAVHSGGLQGRRGFGLAFDAT